MSHTYGVVGLGKSGGACARYLCQNGGAVLACDEAAEPPMAARLRHLPRLELVLGEIPGGRLAQCAAVFLSPGVPRSHPGLQAALAAGVPLINDVEWLYRQSVQDGANPCFIGITGTNGKSTVTSLVCAMMKAAGKRMPCGGNLGRPALEMWQPAGDGQVLELSSFQLESIEQFRAQVAAILNITPDHLDRYDGLAGYLAAKARIFENQRPGDTAVINADDPLLAELAAGIRRKEGVALVPFSIRGVVDGGVGVADGCLVDGRTGREVLLPLAEIRIVGRQNQANAAAAAAIALSAGASAQAVVSALQTFPGLPHRMEWVRCLAGVDYYNDSKGTNVGAVVESLSSFPGGVVLIAGGRDKKGDFSPLTPLLRERGAGVVLIGEAAGAMAQTFAGAVPMRRAASMQEAVAAAGELAAGSGVVLLSPACASFDMFKNFEDRGDRFKEAVHAL